MFEFEVNHSRYAPGHLPADIVQRFTELHDQITYFSLLPWEEHCTECAAPQCYATCDLYSPRKDGQCRRFVDGISVVAGVSNCLGYVTRVSFKRWARLMCYANLHLVASRRAKALLKCHLLLSELISRIPDSWLNIRGRRGVSSRLARRLKMRIFNSGRLAETNQVPDFFVCEIYNPGPSETNLTLGLRAADEPLRRMPYQRLIAIQPGFHRICIPYWEMAPHLDPKKQFTIAVGPNINALEEEGLVLYFGLMSFVKADWRLASADIPDAVGTLKRAKAVKVVIWDLDNTLWHGILTEDGPDNVHLLDGVAEIIRTLDQRGIVNSIVSKNDFQPAWDRVKAFGLDEYFVFSRIGWGPKGEAVREVIEDFNVGEDSVVFIDDSPAERFEVKSVNPSVRVLGVSDCAGILELPEFKPPATEESGQRRAYYRDEEYRRQFRSRVPGDYRDFLRQCLIRIRVAPAGVSNLSRAQELIQRTNQLNFSGNRYTRDQIEQIVANPAMQALCIYATDRFGDYGMVGFSVIEESDTPRMMDLMFSCRIQAKRVEHAFLLRLMNVYRQRGAVRFDALYRKTDRNRQASQVFEDLGFICSGQEGDAYTYSHDLVSALPEDDIIEIEWKGGAPGTIRRTAQRLPRIGSTEGCH